MTNNDNKKTTKKVQNKKSQNKVEETKTIKEPETSIKEKSKKSLYVSFNTRLVFNIIAFIIFLAAGTFLLINSSTSDNDKIVEYNEKSYVDYKVYLLKNEFYDEEYLGKDMIYVASLIDKINIDFRYLFNSYEDLNLKFKYNIKASLQITNKSGTRSYFQKTYDLVNDKEVNLSGTNNENINETLNIDYSYYNDIANSFKQAYGVEMDSKLVVYMTITKIGDKNDLIMNENTFMYVNIPLSMNAIDISLDYNQVDTKSKIVKKNNKILDNRTELIISAVSIVIALFMISRIVRKITILHKKKSNYDKFINKVLKEYDRLVVETSNLISFDNKEIIKIQKFTELLDIHDNLQIPIMYYSIVDHQKSYFYITHQNMIYLMTVKAVDLEDSEKSR